MTMIQGRSLRRPLCAALLLSAAFFAGSVAARELMLVGNDEKVSWDDAGKPRQSRRRQGQVLVIDIGGDPLAPTIVIRLPLMNTIFGPPTNLAITPDGKLALVANSMNVGRRDGDGWKPCRTTSCTSSTSRPARRS